MRFFQLVRESTDHPRVFINVAHIVRWESSVDELDGRDETLIILVGGDRVYSKEPIEAFILRISDLADRIR